MHWEKNYSRTKQWLLELSLIKKINAAKIDVNRVERYNALPEVVRK